MKRKKETRVKTHERKRMQIHAFEHVLHILRQNEDDDIRGTDSTVCGAKNTLDIVVSVYRYCTLQYTMQYTEAAYRTEIDGIIIIQVVLQMLVSCKSSSASSLSIFSFRLQTPVSFLIFVSFSSHEAFFL